MGHRLEGTLSDLRDACLSSRCCLSVACVEITREQLEELDLTIMLQIGGQVSTALAQ